MPDVDGIEVVSELLKRRYAGGLILVSSGDLQVLNMARMIASESGLNLLGTLIKPLQQDELRQVLQGIVTD